MDHEQHDPTPPTPDDGPTRVKRSRGPRAALACKQVFTTGEAAVLCGLSQQTIIRSFDNGRLKGFRVPGSTFRRIPREELIRFMRAHHLPMEGLLGQQASEGEGPARVSA